MPHFGFSKKCTVRANHLWVGSYFRNEWKGCRYMKQLGEEEIIKFLKENVEPLPSQSEGDGYRAAVYLVDGTYLPCVIFRGSKAIVEFAMRRFKEEQNKKSIFNAKHGYYDIVKSFVAQGNCINAYDIAKVEKSKYALPLPTLHKIHGETFMSWTGFVARMKDGKLFAFGTSFSFEFFAMPEGYAVEDIAEIINHSYLSESGEMKSYHADTFDLNRENPVIDIRTFRERPYFECYLDLLS